MPKYYVCGGDSWISPEQGMGTEPGCLFPSIHTNFADLGAIFLFNRDPWALHTQLFCVGWKQLHFAWTR